MYEDLRVHGVRALENYYEDADVGEVDSKLEALEAILWALRCDILRSRRDQRAMLKYAFQAASDKSAAFYSDGSLLSQGNYGRGGDAMTRLVDRRTRLMFETPFLIGKRPLIAAIEPRGLATSRKRATRYRPAYYVGAGVEPGGHDRCPGSSGNQQGGFNNEKDIQKGENSSMSVNRVILIGRVGKDPEVKYTASGTPVCRFSLATNESFKDKAGERQEHTEWHSI